ncbi:hypothetical protein SRHO_G00342320 [Serrasalmus rhombeus]
MFLLIEFLGTKTVALVPKSWGKHDVRILKSCNKLFQRFQLEVIQLQYPGSPLLQGCTNLSGRGRGQEQRVFPALQGMCYPRLKEDAGGRIHDVPTRSHSAPIPRQPPPARLYKPVWKGAGSGTESIPCSARHVLPQAQGGRWRQDS